MGLRWWRNFGAALAGVLLFFHGFCYSEKAPNYSFLQEAKQAPPNLYYDYIIIGGGTSGCALAATLSQNATVLVLERGGSPYGNPKIRNLDSFFANILDNSPLSPSQSFISEDGVFNTRARVLGGGSALNAGFYSRASAGFVKSSGWDERLVKESYEWVEKKVVFKPPMLQWQSAVRDGLLEAGVLPYNGFSYEHLYGTKVGGTIFDHQDHRHTAADLLEYANPKNIVVLLHATVEKIEFRLHGESKPIASGVIFRDEVGVRHNAYRRDSKSEIILSAGAIGSPQLLMLSGIGPESHLKAHGIPVILEQPMVGQGMADNPMNALPIPSPRPVENSLIQVVGITTFGSYIEAASGSDIIRSWFHRPPEQLSNASTNPKGTEKAHKAMNTMMKATVRGGIILEKIKGPISTGHLKLRTTNPEDNPYVTFNYFEEPEDLQRCVEGMRTIIKVINSKAFSKFRFPHIPVQLLIDMMVYSPVNLRPRHVGASIFLEQFCIDTVMTIWHYHGGCHVGRVVEPDYKVIGVDGLRIIDGSTFNHSPGTNPQATVMMLGRYMGEKILGER
ncbi:protein HOTHEAD isoform X2 [Vitis vinifera]|uniref:Glucose-methanol-choline oxidoreductase N-terminal domain-containing protein n=2 Tax=Vitis vinifera TaxID=29760 RepID=F6HP77_VITVI|nr:protein HOTHEAD isoform X2 [Vitis vinifera]|eukprot:XP_002267848.2 PREDICTED: protein HOTHEAD [Vitis vinifera]